jgi:patatin-like phospholipase/acyl hydrolase
MKCRYRIVVSIDGSGIRGIIPLRVLSKIEQMVSELDSSIDLASSVDLYAGSSTGSIIGGALMMQDYNGKTIHSPSSILNFFTEKGAQLFRDKTNNEVINSSVPFDNLLESFCGSINLENLKKHFLFVSYDLNSDSQFLFTDVLTRFRHLSLSKMMQACSALPGFLSPVKLGNLLLMDGSIAAKNPSTLAYNYARKLYPNDPIIFISLGTGKGKENHLDIIEKEIMLTDDDLYFSAKKEKNLLYFRFQPTIIEASSDLADSSQKNISRIISDVDKYIESHIPKFERLLRLVKTKVDTRYDF